MLYSYTIKLVRFYEGADGLKTGHTDNAGYCLAATAKKNNMRLIGIVLGESDSKVRNSETMALLDYGFLHTKYKLVKRKGDVIQKVKLDKSSRSTVNVVLKDDLGVVEMVDDDKHNYEYEIDLDDIKLPVKAGESVGKVLVKENSKTIVMGDLTVDKDIKRLGFWELFFNSIKSIADGNL